MYLDQLGYAYDLSMTLQFAGCYKTQLMSCYVSGVNIVA